MKSSVVLPATPVVKGIGEGEGGLTPMCIINSDSNFASFDDLCFTSYRYDLQA